MEKEAAIKFTVGGFGDESTIIIPLWENYNNNTYVSGEAATNKEAFSELAAIFGEDEWGFHGKAYDFHLTEHEREEETLVCDEFDLYVYPSEAYREETYARPFDENPEGGVFSSFFAFRCFVGEVYSKDFAYYWCEACCRYVCGQNPSNGWHSQVHIHDGWVECNKCYEERVLSEGCNNDFDGGNIPGQFFNDDEISGAGWKLQHDCINVGSGRFGGYRNPDEAINILKNYHQEGVSFLVNYEDMAIGGMGGTISIYTK